MFTVLLTCLGIFLLEANSVGTGITPDFAVRLNNPFGNSSSEGRLEIYYNGTWGTVCDDSFTNASANLACASLGFVHGEVIDNSYGAGTGQIWLDEVSCTGTESGIEQCPHRGWGVHDCDDSEDVSISCVCGSRYFSASTGTISSPNFPNAYANKLDCYNYISVSPGFAVVLTFLAFNTESCCDWVTITCEPGNAFKSARYSGLEFPSVLTISSCHRVNITFHTDGSATRTGFSLTYNITSDTIIGGITTKPSSAFPNSDKDERVIFNCTSASKYLPWWTINGKEIGNYTVTNSNCGVVMPMPYGSWFVTETLGPGSCNLMVFAPACELYRLTGSLVCTDSTLASARALLVPIKIGLNVMKVTNSSTKATNVVKDEDVRISCTPSFFEYNSNPSLVFTYAVYYGGPLVQIRILRTYWTSQGNVVSSINTSTASSYVLLNAITDVIPPYTCNIVCDFFSNISSISGGYPLEISDSTDPINVLFTEDYKHRLKILAIILGSLLGGAVLIIVILAKLLFPKCRQQKTNTTSDVGHIKDGDEHELQQKGNSNHYEASINDVEVEYENLNDSRRPLPTIPAIYEELRNQK